MGQKPGDPWATNRTLLGVLEEPSIRSDGANRRQLAPVCRERDQGRLAPGSPSLASDTFQCEAHLIQVNERRTLSYLFFSAPVRPVPARRQSGARYVLQRVHRASED